MGSKTSAHPYKPSSTWNANSVAASPASSCHNSSSTSQVVGASVLLLRTVHMIAIQASQPSSLLLLKARTRKTECMNTMIRWLRCLAMVTLQPVVHLLVGVNGVAQSSWLAVYSWCTYSLNLLHMVRARCICFQSLCEVVLAFSLWIGYTTELLQCGPNNEATLLDGNGKHFSSSHKKRSSFTPSLNLLLV